MPESPLTPTYDPAPVEVRWSSFWELHGLFRVDTSRAGRSYCIVIPPPNITGSLHLGHALNNTLQDILIRWRRMAGDRALWIPGTDHAGIATQNVVERHLLAENKTRQQLGREAFIERVWEWRNESGRTIITQLKKLGASCDWSRERFTMDEGLSAAVREVFVRLYDDGLIYRGVRLINWCPRCQTALSDIEVEHEEARGKLYHLKYPLTDDPNLFLTVATTRPETLLGDTAVAVHPDDPRFNRFIGKQVRLPLTSRTIPVVGDPILVDREFGTGAVKITPAHDFNDEKAGQRHKLPSIAILDEQARIRPTLGEHGVDADVLADIAQLTVPKARVRVEHWLRERGALLKVEEHTHAIGKCYRCRTVVEPYLSPQWFVGVNTPGKSSGKTLAAEAIGAVRSGRIRLIPEGWANNYFGWMEQIQDWCISRQIWWGHQIPAWYCRGNDVESCRPACKAPIVALRTPERCPHCGSTDLVQDPDVLDTWFSSALWPFSTLGWPEQTKELSAFYPTSTLVTSFDILFFWVARMIMMGLYVMKEVPFRDVYIHALVRDAEGQKMSKSKGNVIDPLEIMAKYGTDALRFTLASMASPGRDIRLAEERIAGYRNFANKLWNATRFIVMNLDGPRHAEPPPERTLADRWIISRLHRCIGDVNVSLETYRFDEAAARLYQFIWHEYCDWYLELIKPVLADKESHEAPATRQTLIETFEPLLRLLHPFMPFITEEIWQVFPHQGESIMVSPYPAADAHSLDDSAEKQIALIQAIVSGAREHRVTAGIAPSQKLAGGLFSRDHQVLAAVAPTNVAKAITQLGRFSDWQVNPAERPSHATVIPLTLPGGQQAELLVQLLQNTTDIADYLLKERTKTEKRLGELSAQIARDEKTLANQGFLSKAPPAEVEKIKARHREAQHEHQTLRDKLRSLDERAQGVS
ncbi:MAG TPA: valine--tRNA ligase [Nitrospiria bacterium]|nr:valine--tRNA ligase [Nitrospiria bacterium]